MARQKIQGCSRESATGTSKIKGWLSALPRGADLAVTRVWGPHQREKHLECGVTTTIQGY